MEAVYLDTHVVIWLFYGFTEKISVKAKKLINSSELLISPIILLEIEYLFEIKKISHKPDSIFQTLHREIGLEMCQVNFATVINHAGDISFTKDPFDRMIIAHAKSNDRRLITRDKQIRNNFNLAVW